MKPMQEERETIHALLTQRSKSQPYIVKHWHTPQGAADQCAESVEVLRRELSEDTGRVWVRRPSVSVPHCLALLPSGGLVDLTAKQFDPDADCPMYFTGLDDLGREWSSYTLSNWHDDVGAEWIGVEPLEP